MKSSKFDNFLKLKNRIFLNFIQKFIIFFNFTCITLFILKRSLTQNIVVKREKHRIDTCIEHTHTNDDVCFMPYMFHAGGAFHGILLWVT